MKPGKVRIIAGRLRGSRLEVPERSGLRPTSDRVRETLFNWLQDHIVGKRCLDLFAGSGALGFEAASRGAARVVMVERDRELCARLRADAARLNTPEVEVQCVDALAYLSQAATQRFDLVFVDPPFAEGLHHKVLSALIDGRWLAPGARVYLEAPLQTPPAAPVGWQLLREGRTREVAYALYLSDTAPPPDTLANLIPPLEPAPA